VERISPTKDRDSFEHCNAPGGFVKGRGIFGKLSDCQLLKTDFVPWSYLYDSRMLSDTLQSHIACTKKNAFQAKGTNQYIYI
jgi:hypothetical protein